MAKHSEIPQSTKMRMRVYHPELGLSDRLVEQSTELRMGPKEPLPNGATLSFEFNLTTQEELDLMVNYIKKLKGELPIVKPEKQEKAAKKLNDMLSEKEPLLDLMKTVLAKAKTQEELISELRAYNFMFIDSQFLQDVAKPDQITLEEKHVDKYQWMVRRIKEAKDPANDKFDFRLAFGIKVLGKRVETVVIYLWGTKNKVVNLPWKIKKAINFKKVDVVLGFPEMMDYNERKKWRQEHRKFLTATKNGENPEEFKASKFYLKWKPYVSGL